MQSQNVIMKTSCKIVSVANTTSKDNKDFDKIMTKN